MKLFTTIFCVCAILTKINAEDSDITKFMKHLEVIPDVIDEGPQHYLKIIFDSGVEGNKGIELTPTQVKNPPQLEWEAEPGAFYSLIMTDPDSPSRKLPVEREWHHWLVVNIPETDIGKGDTLTEFVSSAPPKDTGLHRYTFLVYKQPGKLEFDEPKISNMTEAKRENFSCKKFAKKYNLGAPVAGNVYQAQWDEYVPTVHRQLGIN